MKKLRNQRTQSKCIKFSDYVEKWYKTYKMSTHALTTVQVQLNYINTHIKPSTLGNTYIHLIREQDIQMFINDLLKNGNKCKLKNSKTFGNGLSKGTTKKILAIITTTLKQAHKEHLIDYNYAEDITPIKLEKLPKPFFSFDEEKLFLEKTRSHRYHLAYKLLFRTGCRRSEILGLSWDNVFFDRKCIQISQVLIIPNNVPMIKPFPKTNASLRHIPLHIDLMNELKAHLKNQMLEKKNIGSAWHNDYNLVFVTKDGLPCSPQNFSQNFKKQVKRLGLDASLHVHSTRHTFATNMLQINTPFVDLQALGGWASSDVLLETYAHTVKASHRKAMNKLHEQSK